VENTVTGSRFLPSILALALALSAILVPACGGGGDDDSGDDDAADDTGDDAGDDSGDDSGDDDTGQPTWAAMDSGTTRTLRAVWGASSDDVFIVGEAGTILLHGE
jgi:hypothetical protein